MDTFTLVTEIVWFGLVWLVWWSRCFGLFGWIQFDVTGLCCLVHIVHFVMVVVLGFSAVYYGFVWLS